MRQEASDPVEAEPNPLNRSAERNSATAGMRRNLVGNSAVIAFCRFLTAISTFLATPFVLHRMGLAGVGVWEMLFALSLWVAMLEGGVGGATLRYVSDAWARGDERAMSRYVGSGVFVNLLLMVLVAPLSFLLRFPILEAIHVPASLIPSAAVVLPVILTLASAVSTNTCISSVISAKQKTGITSIVVTVATVLEAVATVSGLIAGYGLYSLAMGKCISASVMLISSSLTAKRIAPTVSLHPVVPTFTELKTLYGYGSMLFITNLSDMMGQQTDKLILGAFATAALVGIYGIASKLAGILKEINRFIYGPLVPASAFLEAHNDQQGLAKLYAKALKAQAAGTGLLVCLIVGLHRIFEQAWLGRYVPSTTPFLFGLAFAYFVSMTTGPGTAICRGTGRIKIETTYSSINGVMQIILTICLTALLGGVGTVVATVVSLSISSLIFFRVLHRKTHLPLSATLEAFKIIALAWCVTVPVYWATTMLHLTAHRLTAFLELGAAGIGCVAVYAAMLLGSGVLSIDLCKRAVRAVRAK